MEHMQKFISAAFQPPSRTYSTEGKRGFAILPQQSRDEIMISQVHTKLDRVLLFLQREIGYALLEDARPRSGGGVQLERQPQESSVAPMAPRGARIPREEAEASDDGHRQTIRFTTETAKYAHYADDLVLVWRFANVLAESHPSADVAVRRDMLYKTVLQGIRLMHLCSYDYSDLVVTLAYASVYFRTICDELGHQMSDAEASHVSVLLIFLAHSFVIDESCPLKYWQKYIFRNYCTLKVLDAALYRIFEMQGFHLRVSAEDEKHALSVLLCSAGELDVVLSAHDGNFGTTASTTAASSGGHREESLSEASDC